MYVHTQADFCTCMHAHVCLHIHSSRIHTTYTRGFMSVPVCACMCVCVCVVRTVIGARQLCQLHKSHWGQSRSARPWSQRFGDEWRNEWIMNERIHGWMNEWMCAWVRSWKTAPAFCLPSWMDSAHLTVYYWSRKLRSVRKSKQSACFHLLKFAFSFPPSSTQSF